MIEILNKSRCRYNFRLMGLILLATSLSAPIQAAAVDKDSQVGCRCHQPMVDSILSKPYIHPPFLQKKCLLCHAGDAEATSASIAKTSRRPTTIKWFEESPTPATVHCFRITNLAPDDVLYIEAGGAASRLPRIRLTIPHLESLPLKKDAERPPAISGIQILSVKRELFLTATIGWHTDTLADATVSYGLDDDLTQKATLTGSLLHDHQMTLVDLKANKTYHFTVSSADLAGQRTVSEVKSFSTSQETEGPTPAEDDFSPEKEEKFVVQSDFFRYGDTYLLQLSSSRPATFYVGVPTNQSEERRRGIKENMADHPALSSDLITRSEACLKCHPDSEGKSSHPVNVFPPPGMEIPAEYPTMADGMITCMTCHAPHGSDFEYRLLKRKKRDLCIGCHKEMA